VIPQPLDFPASQYVCASSLSGNATIWRANLHCVTTSQWHCAVFATAFDLPLDAPIPREVERVRRQLALPILGGLSEISD